MRMRRPRIQTVKFFAQFLSPHLKTKKFAAEKSFQPAIRKSFEALNVVSLRGTPLQRASAIGKLVRKGELSDATLRFFANAFNLIDVPSVSLGILKGLYRKWSAVQLSYAPWDFLNELFSFATTAGVNFDELEHALTIPDASILAAHLGRSVQLPSFGCTSIAKSFSDGSFCIGRNLDFAGVHVWDASPLVVVHHPTNDELKHVSISTSPLFFGSITGINEAGITLAIHQNFTSEVLQNGIPMYFIGESVLRRSRTLDDAIEILRKNRPGPLWTFVLGDLNNNQMIAVESSANRYHFRKMEKDFVQTNHLHLADQQIQSHGTAFGLSTKFRFEKCQEALKKIQAKNVEQDFAKLLSYQAHAKGELSSNRDVLKPLTIQTVLFKKDPENKVTLYISKDLAPTASGSFVKIDLHELWDSPGLETVNLSSVDLTRSSPETRQNQIAVSRAYRAYIEEKDYLRAAELLSEQNTQGAFLVRAICLYKSGLFVDALTLIDTALGRPTEVTGDLRNSLVLVKILCMAETEAPKKDLVSTAKALDKSQIHNPDAKELINKILNDKPLSSFDFKLGYDWFGGDLHWGFGL